MEDGNALTQYLLSRFSRDKIYLAGESWGSALGIFLAGKYPQDYYAFIGTGQMVDFLETEKQDYDKALEIAVSRNDTDKVKKWEAAVFWRRGNMEECRIPELSFGIYGKQSRYSK